MPEELPLLAASIASPTAATAPPAARPAAAWRWAPPLILAVLALASRAPWSGSAGEPDCARYLLGLLQWLRASSGAPYIYAKVLSPGYYAAAAWLVQHTGAAAAGLLSHLSLWAAVVSAPLLYWVGRQLTSAAAALAAAVLYLFAPGFWWLGLEIHPQGLSFLLLLLALLCALRARPAGSRRWAWTAAAAVAMGAGMLLKNDLILMGAVFPALHLGPRRAGWRRDAGMALAIPSVGLALFYLGRQLALGLSWGAAQQQTTAAVAEFLTWPHGSEVLKQVLPLLTAPGVATLAATVLVLLWAGSSHAVAAAAWRRRWGWLLAAWVLPQLAFWMAIRGNNARHMASYILLPLWAALDWVLPQLRRRRRRSLLMLGAACVLVLAANAALVPASSNTTLFPSGNVPASRRDLAARTAEMHTWMDARLPNAAAAAPPAACFLGNSTLPYMELALLQAHPRATMDRAGLIRLDSGGVAAFIEVNFPAEYHAAAAACQQAGAAVWSLEYAPSGLHLSFLGEELDTLPGVRRLTRRWYPGGRAPIGTAVSGNH